VIAILIATLLSLDPFWQTKSPPEWTDSELMQLLTESPWAQMAPGPGNSSPVLIFLATAAPMRQAEEERERRAGLKRKSNETTEGDILQEEYRAWLEENRESQLVLAVRVTNTKAFSDEREVRRMEEQCVMRIGRKKIKITGHFPASVADPYLRLAFPREVTPADKAVAFDLYIPGVSAPFRTAEFSVREMLVKGALEL
jgi:hypothetical protein